MVKGTGNPSDASSPPRGVEAPSTLSRRKPVTTGGITRGAITTVERTALPGKSRRASNHPSPTAGTRPTKVARKATMSERRIADEKDAARSSPMPPPDRFCPVSSFTVGRDGAKPSALRIACPESPKTKFTKSADNWSCSVDAKGTAQYSACRYSGSSKTNAIRTDGSASASVR